MANEKPISVTPWLSRALHRIRTTPPRIIASPRTQPRRAAVAILIRIVPGSSCPPPAAQAAQPSLSDFFQQEWVNAPDAQAEILFLKRDAPSPEETVISQPRIGRNEAHVAFPGGRTEPDDEGGMYTALRQTWEEIGIDLAEKNYMCIGQLDDREITTSLGKRLLMILSPFVFLQVTPQAPPPDPVPSTTLHWTPLASLVSPQNPPKWSTVTVDAASRLAPRHSVALKLLVRVLVGSMEFPAIVIEPSSSTPTSQTSNVLKLWGLSLGMTLDLMSYMIIPTKESHSYCQPSLADIRVAGNLPKESRASTPLGNVMQLPYHTPESLRMEVVAPSLASVFPRFSYPDVNFWIWVFGKRYREVVRGWEASIRSGGVNDRRINWSGQALSTFYASIRKALVVVIVARALAIIFGLVLAGWWIFSS
ncbi:nudix family hydrolase [Moniliophthora roreri]|uniref:Nudix hydrolase domain-containing protein n=1 Tax=Moniliophthora roreri TaxID=221103 RepID=A0A0W0FAP5_MONRR|nr:nudix family hydrolase [Moniliophthora roreri]